MKIEYERTGGVAGMRMAATIDSDRLSPEEARQLEQNLAAARFFDLPAAPAAPGGTGADRFHYRISVESAGRKHTIDFGEAAMPESLQPLVRQLTLLARSKGER